MTADRSSGGEIRALTSLRGIAAMAVVMQHFSATAQRHSLTTIPSLIPHGYIAVELFFVLSGFIMAYTYLPARRRLWLLFAGLALLSLFVHGSYVRQATFTLLFLSVAAALGADSLFAAVPRWTALPLLVFAAVGIDQSPLVLQPWTRSDMAGLVAAGDALARRAPDSRTMEVWNLDGHPDVSVGPDSTPLAYARVQMLSGPHKQDATPAHNAGTAVLKLAAADLKATGALSPAARDLLALSNIGWVVGIGATQPGLPLTFADTIPDPELGPYWRIPEATPFVVSGQVEQMDRPLSFDALPFWITMFDAGLPATKDAMEAVRGIQVRMGADLANRRARAILLPVVPAAWHNDPAAAPVARPVAYSVAPGRVALTIEADRSGFVRLVHPMAATVSVTLDGAPADAMADVESLIVLPIHAGVNAIVVTAAPSRLRQVCFWLSAATVLALAVVLCHAGWRRNRCSV